MASTDARPFPLKNTAFRAVFPIFDKTGALVTGAAGLDSEVSKDQGTFADCANEATEIATSSGIYYLDLTSTEMNADCVSVIVKTSTTDARTTVLVFYPVETGDIPVNVTAFGGSALTASGGRPEVNVSHIGGSAVTASGGRPEVNVSHFGGSAGSFSSGRPEVNTTHAAGTAWNSGAIGANTLASDTITAAKVAANAIGASELASDAVTEIQSGLALAADLATVAGYIDTEVAAIKAKTDNLPASPAAVGDIPTANQNADALLDRTAGVETSWTLRQAMRVMLAVLAGKSSGHGTSTVVYRDMADSKDRVSATVSSGNRSAVTRDAS